MIRDLCLLFLIFVCAPKLTFPQSPDYGCSILASSLNTRSSLASEVSYESTDGSCLLGGSSKDEASVSSSRVFPVTYDGAFAGSLEAIARLGMFVEAQDKDKGYIAGKGTYLVSGGGPRGKSTFVITISSVSSKPETRIDIVGTVKAVSGFYAARENRHYSNQFTGDLLAELQKVLVTYK